MNSIHLILLSMLAFAASVMASTPETPAAVIGRRVFFEMVHELPEGKKKLGTIVIGLYDNKKIQKTTDNFFVLATTGINGNIKESYKGSPFHRIIREFMIQGGDFDKKNGTGGKSIYGRKFKDDDMIFKHTKAGLLSMANAGPDTNGSQFFITTVPTPWLDGKHVVFGEVVQGYDVVQKIEATKTVGDAPVVGQIVIADCGEYTDVIERDDL